MFNLGTRGAVDGDNRRVIVATYKQVGDGQPIEGDTDAAQVLSHRVDAGDPRPGEREPSAISHHIGVSEPALAYT